MRLLFYDGGFALNVNNHFYYTYCIALHFSGPKGQTRPVKPPKPQGG